MSCSNKNKNPPESCTFEQDFGNYAETWKHHKGNYESIVRITNSYIVFINKNHDIDWETTEEYDKELKVKNIEKDHSKYISECQNLDQQPIEGLSKKLRISLQKIIGEAIVNCLELDFEATKKILADAEKFRLDRLIEKSREWYLSYTIVFSCILLGVIYFINKEYILQLQAQTIEMINSGAFAIVGACFSIILRSGQLSHASYAGRKLHALEAFSRLLGGLITGIIVYFGIKSGLLFSSIFTSEHSQYLFPLLSILTGASERFSPSIITHIEKISLPEPNGEK